MQPKELDLNENIYLFSSQTPWSEIYRSMDKFVIKKHPKYDSKYS